MTSDYPLTGEYYIQHWKLLPLSCLSCTKSKGGGTTGLPRVCSDVCIEPELQPITGESLTGASSNVQDGAHLDIAANSFWGGRFERTYFDVPVSTHMPPPTGNPASLHVTANKNLWRNMRTRLQAESRRSRTCLFYPISSVQRGKWISFLL